MNTVLAILGSLGGVAAVIGLITVSLRAIVKQVNAVNGNTTAVQQMTNAVKELSEKMAGHETRITILEDHDRHRHTSTPRSSQNPQQP